jgi:hypothetical protein
MAGRSVPEGHQAARKEYARARKKWRREITPEEYKNATGQILVGGVRVPRPKE